MFSLRLVLRVLLHARFFLAAPFRDLHASASAWPPVSHACRENASHHLGRMDRDHKDNSKDMELSAQRAHIPSLPDEPLPSGLADVNADDYADTQPRYAQPKSSTRTTATAASAQAARTTTTTDGFAVSAYPHARADRRRFVLAHTAFSTGSFYPFVVVLLSAPILWLCLVATRQFHSRFLPNGGIPSSSSWSTGPVGDAPAGSADVGGLVARFDDAVAQCALLGADTSRPRAGHRESNPRWTPGSGQQQRIVLRNATLFDGEEWHAGPMDVLLDRGMVAAVVESTAESPVAWEEGVRVFQLHGRYVTPGLVDMHSHHMTAAWPVTEMSEDADEMHASTGAFTPMVHAIDALKPYDVAVGRIAAGGVTSSLILPGSNNLIGGEAVTVKNAPGSGAYGEPVVRDLLLERGVPHAERRRYMKTAFGENPKTTWGYTRLGNAWHLREHLQKAKTLKEEQDDYCLALGHVGGGSGGLVGERQREQQARFIRDHGKFPFSLELESTIGVLRGRVHVHNHNYEPEDMETMLRIGDEFGFRIWAFHHALAAWRIPELLKEQGQNTTIATFADCGLYKLEAYDSSLYAGHVLNAHGIPVAYKSDHGASDSNDARYLMSQASTAYGFGLSETKALQSVTSIPAKAIDLDFRIGYCRPSYDADVVIWNDHPLAIGATPLQVFIDGIPQLDDEQVQEVMGASFHGEVSRPEEGEFKPQIRSEPPQAAKELLCSAANQPGQSFIITGIQRAFVDKHPLLQSAIHDAHSESLQLIITDGVPVCLGSEQGCAVHSSSAKAAGEVSEIRLENGYLVPGLTALTRGLGMREIALIDSTGDGDPASQRIDDPESINYAKYGVWLDGKGFSRARLGGVTRAISPPLADSAGLVTGVSVQILTSGKKTLLDGGIVQGDVALHLSLGQRTKISEGTVSDGVKHIRKMLDDGKGRHKETIFGRVASGELPLVVQTDNKVWATWKRETPRSAIEHADVDFGSTTCPS